MQLGELQSQIHRFERRGATVIALSVDAPADSLAMIDRLGLSFALGSDPEQNVVKAFKVQNPDTEELALHAVYIVNKDGEVFYRKVARRRPVSEELIDAIDYYQGNYPQSEDAPVERGRIPVAYPRNNFQALLELTAGALPMDITPEQTSRIERFYQSEDFDEALIAFRGMIRVYKAQGITDEALLKLPGWVMRQRFFNGETQIIDLGTKLQQRLERVSELREQHQAATDEGEKDKLLHTLARARGSLSPIRAEINNKIDSRRLSSAKTLIRTYREVVRAAIRSAEQG
ncbi:MAG: redoxin domain-containing protein [Pseudomonadota bacterium]